MSAKDIYHETVRHALIKDGWTITHDPFRLKFGKKTLYADLGAERLIAAEKACNKIIVEIKSFVGRSELHDLHEAVGQYVLYDKIIQAQQLDRHLYLAVSEMTYNGIFSTDLGQLLMTTCPLRVIVFDEDQEVLTQWIPT